MARLAYEGKHRRHTVMLILISLHVVCHFLSAKNDKARFPEYKRKLLSSQKLSASQKFLVIKGD
jgi:hypothetical protein